MKKVLIKRRIISTLTALTLMLSFGVSSSVFAVNKYNSGEACIAKIQQKINTSKMMHDISKLSTGDDARVVGFEGEEKAADYLVKEFKKYGLATRVEEFNVGKDTTTEISDLFINGKSIDTKASTYAASTKGDLKGEIIYANYGSDEDFKDLDVNGKIVLMTKGGNITDSVKINNAKNKGAKAVIIQTASNTSLSASRVQVDIPVVSIFNDDGQEIISQLQNNEILNAVMNVNIVVTKNPKSRNVIGKIQATKNPETAKTIVIGAHFDCVSTPGANDNASGTTVLLEAARLLSDKSLKLNLNYNIEFVAFGAEEVGLLGSKAYVQKLQDEGNVDSIRAMINMDMVGVGDTMSFDYTHVIGEKGELLRQEINELGIKYAQKYDYDYQYEPTTGSDHETFEKVDIPTSYLEYLVDLPGDHNFEWAPYYHTDRDTIETIKPENLYNIENVLLSVVIDLQDM